MFANNMKTSIRLSSSAFMIKCNKCNKYCYLKEENQLDTDIPAYKLNKRTAGIGVNAPRKNAILSETDVNNIAGPTRPTIRAI